MGSYVNMVFNFATKGDTYMGKIFCKHNCLNYFTNFDKKNFMGAIIIKSENTKNLKLLTALAEQLGENVSKLSIAQVEDIHLGLMMKKNKTSIPVPREKIFKHLDS